MRVQPKAWIGFLVFFAYLAVFYGVWIVTGIEYSRIGESTETLIKWYFAPLAAGAVVLVVAISILGWWRPVLFEKERGPRWPIFAPLLMVVSAIAIFATKDHSETEPITWVVLIAGSLLVGFCEEVVSRGVLVVGLRGRFKEVMVWFLSTLFFGLLHLPNAFFGLGLTAVGQVFFAMAGGTVFYIARRSSGTLLVPMVIHAIWDFSTVGGVSTDTSNQIGQVAVGANIVFAAVLIFFVLRPTRGRRVEQFGATAVPATA